MDKQKQILSAALRLFVTEGFHGTPTSKIAQEAGVANGTLFHYYKTKDDLVIGLYNNIKDELSTAMYAITHVDDFITTRFKNIFVQTLYWALDNRDKFYYIQQFQYSPHLFKISPETIQQQAMAHRELLADGVKKKVLIQQPLELIFMIFSNQIFGIYQYLSTADLTPAEQTKAINNAYEMVWELLRYK